MIFILCKQIVTVPALRDCPSRLSLYSTTGNKTVVFDRGGNLQKIGISVYSIVFFSYTHD